MLTPPMVRAGPWYITLGRILAVRVGSDEGGLVLDVFLDRMDDTGRMALIKVTQADDAARLLEIVRERTRIGPEIEYRTYDDAPARRAA